MLRVDADAALPVELDPERLAQIVANLVENALKYATAKIAVSTTASGPARVAIVVVDDGPGIPADDLPKVFERLYTARATPGRSVGTGLGLAIVRQLADAMDGTTAVDTPAEGGTRFIVSLPASSTSFS